MLPVPVDEQGICTNLLPFGATFAYITPSHQNPVGGTLPLERREQVLAWARDNGTYVIEDDIAWEFHYDNSQPPALKALDRDGLVIYCGSFSLTLGAGLRLGFLVLPRELAHAALSAKTLLDGGCPWLEQVALANLMETGSFARHVAHLRKQFHERRDCLIATLRQRFDGMEVIGTLAGIHVGLVLPDGAPDATVIQQSGAAKGIGIHVTRPCSFGTACASRYRQRTLFLGYGALSVDRIEAAIDRLAEVVDGCYRLPR